MKPAHVRLAVLVGTLATALACGAGITAADRNTITRDALDIATCEQLGQECQDQEDEDPGAKRGSYHCWHEYDECMVDSGLRSIGKAPPAPTQAAPKPPMVPDPEDAAADASSDSGKDGAQ